MRVEEYLKRHTWTDLLGSQTACRMTHPQSQDEQCSSPRGVWQQMRQHPGPQTNDGLRLTLHESVRQQSPTAAAACQKIPHNRAASCHGSPWVRSNLPQAISIKHHHQNKDSSQGLPANSLTCYNDRHSERRSEAVCQAQPIK